ncbi:metallophosphoesterase family protein [Paenibacillus rigui]|uniref:metallophosphoesterase family protein n=1 Tax=Paenibacillus rigui TaxID=554312 RepID=UPI00268CC5EC
MVQRTIAISDIHGCYAEFNRLLQSLSYTPDEDRLILLGDYVDRGPNSREVLDQLTAMACHGNVVMLRGNHDQRFIDWMSNDDPLTQAKFVEHGGLATIQSYCGEEWSSIRWDDEKVSLLKEWIQSRYAAHLDLLSRLPLYYEDEHHIYVHAGLNPAYPQWQEQPERDFMWIRAPFYNQPTVVSKVVVFGHTQTMELHDQSNIWFGGDKIGLDGGCAYGYQLNALQIREPLAYQSFCVPAEGKARNERAVG